MAWTGQKIPFISLPVAIISADNSFSQRTLWRRMWELSHSSIRSCLVMICGQVDRLIPRPVYPCRLSLDRALVGIKRRSGHWQRDKYRETTWNRTTIPRMSRWHSSNYADWNTHPPISHSIDFKIQSLDTEIVFVLCREFSGFGGLEAFGTQIRGFKPGRSRCIFQGEKNPQHAFLRKGSKAVCPMSHIWGM